MKFSEIKCRIGTANTKEELSQVIESVGDLYRQGLLDMELPEADFWLSVASLVGRRNESMDHREFSRIRMEAVRMLYDCHPRRTHPEVGPFMTGRDVIEQALATEYPAALAADIAFHLCDWEMDAAFLVAVQLFPERLPPEVIRRGIIGLIIHAPDHLAAAAKLAGWPVKDTFEVNALDGKDWREDF